MQKSMPTCQCAGETCTCEAIQVPPKLPFWKKHDRPVQSFVAWMAILNVALIAAAPIAMLAAESPRQTTNAASSPVISGVESCVQRCVAETKQCAFASASGTAEQREAVCETRVKDCYSRCALSPQLGLPAGGKDLSATASKELRAKFETSKKRASEFSRNLAQIRLKAAALEKKGMKPPQALKDALISGDALIRKLKSATSTEAIEALGNAQKSMDGVAETLKKQLPAIVKQQGASKKFLAFENALRGLDHQLATAKKLTVSASNTERAQQLADAEAALNELKTTYRQARDLIIAGSVDEGFSLLESQVPTQLDNAKKLILALRSLQKRR